MERKIFNSKRHTNEYLKYLYHKPEINGKMPLLINLHGAGGRGDDLSLIQDGYSMVNAIKFVGDKAIIVSPQCHKTYWFDHFETLTEFIDEMRHLECVDIDRVYITGGSMGGYTTWQMCLSHPDWFAAAVPVCGGGMHWAGAGLKDLPIWATHGALDTTVLPEETIHMVKIVNLNGGNAKITIYPDVRHDAWVPTYSDSNIWDWMFSQRRNNNTGVVSEVTDELKKVINEK